MKVFIEKDMIEKTMTYHGKASELLKKLKINPETVLLIRNNTLISDDEVLKDSDKIKILSAVSGG